MHFQYYLRLICVNCLLCYFSIAVNAVTSTTEPNSTECNKKLESTQSTPLNIIPSIVEKDIPLTAENNVEPIAQTNVQSATKSNAQTNTMYQSHMATTQKPMQSNHNQETKIPEMNTIPLELNRGFSQQKKISEMRRRNSLCVAEISSYQRNILNKFANSIKHKKLKFDDIIENMKKILNEENKKKKSSSESSSSSSSSSESSSSHTSTSDSESSSSSSGKRNKLEIFPHKTRELNILFVSYR